MIPGLWTKSTNPGLSRTFQTVGGYGVSTVHGLACMDAGEPSNKTPAQNGGSLQEITQHILYLESAQLKSAHEWFCMRAMPATMKWSDNLGSHLVDRAEPMYSCFSTVHAKDWLHSVIIARQLSGLWMTKFNRYALGKYYFGGSKEVLCANFHHYAVWEGRSRPCLERVEVSSHHILLHGGSPLCDVNTVNTHLPRMWHDLNKLLLICNCVQFFWGTVSRALSHYS